MHADKSCYRASLAGYFTRTIENCPCSASTFKTLPSWCLAACPLSRQLPTETIRISINALIFLLNKYRSEGSLRGFKRPSWFALRSKSGTQSVTQISGIHASQVLYLNSKEDWVIGANYLFICAEVVELVDTSVSKTDGFWPCRFDSGLRHQNKRSKGYAFA